jgi:hypothetical protein
VSGTTKSTEQSIANQKHKSKPAIRLDHDGHKLNKATENKNCGSKGYRTTESIDVFLAFSWILAKRQKLSRRHNNTSRVT